MTTHLASFFSSGPAAFTHGAAGHSQPTARSTFHICRWRAVGCLLACALSGCMMPMDRQSSLDESLRQNLTAEIAAQLTKEMFVGPPAPMTFTVPTRDGGVILEIPPSTTMTQHAMVNADEESASDATSNFATREKLAWGLVVLFGGLGLILCAVGAWLLLKLLSQSKAVKAAWNVADGYIARIASDAKSRAAESTDPAVTRELMGVVADVERDRAEINKPL